MRIKINIFLALIIFLVVDLVLLGIIFYLTLISQKNVLTDLGVSSKSATVPFLKEDIEALRINSKAFVIYEPESRSVIAGKNDQLRFSPASTAKIMTALIALEEYHLDRILSVNGVSTVIGSKMKLEEGELITVENLLYGLMLPSGNDAAYVLARNYIGGRNTFISQMNAKANELKLLNTHFTDPAGLDDENYSTAIELARLATYAMSNEKFREIVSTRSKTVYDISGNVVHELTNLNELLGLEGVIGIKTGFTEEAGGVLITALENKNKLYIIVVLNSTDRFKDTKEIIFNAVSNVNLISY